jgi:4'-phosphopantetheinyl transferase
MPFQLESHEVHVWCTFFAEIDDEALLDEYRQLLSEDERSRLWRFAFERDRHRYLVTRALARSVLSRYADVAPAAWLFGENRFGRPQIVNNQPQARDLSFNISHTNSLIVLGLARGRAIGFDTENVSDRTAPFTIAERFFSPEEAAALDALPESHRQRRFFEYWTLKESYIKARSVGLSIPLDACTFRFVGDEHVAMSIRPDVDSGARWDVWQFSIDRDYVTAICAERVGPRAPALVVRRIVPLRPEHDLIVEDLRTSC